MNKINLSYILLLYFFSISNLSKAQCVSVAADGNSFSSVALTGLIPWTNPTNAQLSDNKRAISAITLLVASSVNTDYLKAENFGFSVPTGTTICGIQVSVERRGSGINLGSITDNVVRLEKGGSQTGSNYAAVTNWTSNDLKVSYGGPTDLWGTTWTPAEINATNFGCFFSANITGLAGAFIQAEVDQIQISVYYNPTPLPIELLDFDVTLLEGKKVKAEWTTASEENNNYFEVERSVDAQHWEIIKTIKGAGNSKELIHYDCVDEKPYDGVSFYRLKQTDFDGKGQYSYIISINFVSEGDWIKIGANPVTNSITLNCIKNEDALLIFYIYDLQGNLVKNTDQIELKKDDEYTIEIPVNELSKGMYLYKAVANQNTVTGKIIKN
jgi:hypothetical protein